MTVIDPILENQTYNLTKLFSPDLLNDPARWIVNYNEAMGGFYMITALAIIGIVLFIIAKRSDEIEDTQAAVYAGAVTSITGVLLFLIRVDGVKLLEWYHLTIFIVLTMLAIIIDKVTRKY